jgi:hypothetical protein
MDATLIDADGHIFEDAAGICAHLPAFYRDKVQPRVDRLFPPPDHFHGHLGQTP